MRQQVRSVAGERRSAQRREESRLLAALFEAARDAMAITDHQGTILEANPSLSALTGWPREALVGMNGFQLLGHPIAGETVFIRADGAPITLDYHWVPNIQPDRYLGVARDVTEQRRLREEIEHSREYLRKLVDSMAEGLLTFDVEGLCTWANPAAERLLGVSTELPLPWSAAEGGYRGLLPDGAKVTRETSAVMKVLREGVPIWGVERTIVTTAGERRDVLVNASPLRHFDGAIEGAVVSLNDVTSLKRAERDLALRLRQQAAVASLGQHALAGRTVGELLDTAVSAVAETLAADVVGILELAPDGSELVLRAKHGPTRGPGEVRLPNKDHILIGRAVASSQPLIVADYERSDLELPEGLRKAGVRSGMAVAIPGRPGPYGGLACYSTRPGAFEQVDADFLQAIANVLADAMQRTQAEDALAERSRQLDQARANLEVMLATVQALDHERRELLAGHVAAEEHERLRVARELHDSIGQLLTSASLCAKAVEEAHPAGGPEIGKLRRLLDGALRETRRLAWSLRPLEVEDLGLASALRRLVDNIQQHGGVKVDLHVSRLRTPIPPKVEAATYRVVQEALSNVIRHAAAASASVVVARRGEQLVTVVEDDGKGFSQESQAIGLGLRGMHERAEALGGSLTVESLPGKGTTLRFEVPLT